MKDECVKISYIMNRLHFLITSGSNTCTPYNEMYIAINLAMLSQNIAILISILPAQINGH